MRRLNLGCGRDYREEWDNWDLSKDVKSEAVLDIGRDRFPANDEIYDEIWCAGVLEQISDNQAFLYALNECHRVLKSGGTLTVQVPNARYEIAMRDPFDRRYFLPGTFEYFQKGAKRYNQFGSVYGFKAWNIISIKTRRFTSLYGFLHFNFFKGIMTVVMQKP